GHGLGTVFEIELDKERIPGSLSVAVTGGTGFLGSNLVKGMTVGKDIQVAGLVRPPKASEFSKQYPDVSTVVGDLFDLRALNMLMQDKEALLYIAADSSTNILINNSLGTAQIIDTNVIAPAVALLVADGVDPDLKKVFISSFDVHKIPPESQAWIDASAEKVKNYVQQYYYRGGMRMPSHAEFSMELSIDLLQQGFKAYAYPVSKALMDKVLMLIAHENKSKNVMILRIMGLVGEDMRKSSNSGFLLKLIDAVLSQQEYPAGRKLTPFKGLSASLIRDNDVSRVLTQLAKIDLTKEQSLTPIILELGGERINWGEVVDIIANEAEQLEGKTRNFRQNIYFVDPPDNFVNVEVSPDLHSLEGLLGHPVNITPIRDVIKSLVTAEFLRLHGGVGKDGVDNAQRDSQENDREDMLEERDKLIDLWLKMNDPDPYVANEAFTQLQKIVPAYQGVVPLDILVRLEIEFAQSEARQKNIKIIADIKEEHFFLMTSREYDLKAYVIFELITNALKYTPSGGTITVSLQKEADEIVLSVKDTGIGVPEFEKHLVLLDRYRASNARKMADGTGVGLFHIVRRVKGMRGQFSFESQEGQGSTFTLRFHKADVPLNPLKLSSEDALKIVVEKLKELNVAIEGMMGLLKQGQEVIESEGLDAFKEKLEWLLVEEYSRMMRPMDDISHLRDISESFLSEAKKNKEFKVLMSYMMHDGGISKWKKDFPSWEKFAVVLGLNPLLSREPVDVFKQMEHLIDFLKKDINNNRMHIDLFELGYDLREIDLVPIVRQEVELYRMAALEKGLEFFVDIQDLSLIAKSVDIKYIHFVIKNLIENAIKYTDKGFVKISLEGVYESFHRVPRVVLKVSDSGIGIPEEELFDVTYTGKRGSNVDDRPGEGFGLASVENALGYMGAQLKVESLERNGTTVFVEFERVFPGVFPQYHYINFDVKGFNDYHFLNVPHYNARWHTEGGVNATLKDHLDKILEAWHTLISAPSSYPELKAPLRELVMSTLNDHRDEIEALILFHDAGKGLEKYQHLNADGVSHTFRFHEYGSLKILKDNLATLTYKEKPISKAVLFAVKNHSYYSLSDSNKSLASYEKLLGVWKKQWKYEFQGDDNDFPHAVELVVAFSVLDALGSIKKDGNHVPVTHAENMLKVLNSTAINLADKAQGPDLAQNGGIDLSQDKVTIKQGTTAGVQFEFNPALVAQIKQASGLVPNIIGIQPLTMSVADFCGVKDIRIPVR
ncbi:MAG: ATP-binding protein, partial [Candidatus Omnitrophota bacterium]